MAELTEAPANPCLKNDELESDNSSRPPGSKRLNIRASREQGMGWKKLLASSKESLNNHMRLRNKYLIAENRILPYQMESWVQLTTAGAKNS